MSIISRKTDAAQTVRTDMMLWGLLVDTDFMKKPSCRIML